MNRYLTLLILGAIIGVISIIFIVAYILIKDKKKTIGFDRHMKDSEIIKRLLKYARPYALNFVAVGVLMLFSIAYDIVSPLLVGYIEEMIKGTFEQARLFALVAVYAGILILSLVSSYFQSIILQITGQKIVSGLRQDVFGHIESLSHEQLNNTHVGTLVTRVANDTNGISHMFTNIVVNLVKNVFVILGVLTAMLCLNYMLTLMVLCFVPFIVLFTIIFRKFCTAFATYVIFHNHSSFLVLVFAENALPQIAEHFVLSKFKVLSKCCQHDVSEVENPCKIKAFCTFGIIPTQWCQQASASDPSGRG